MTTPLSTALRRELSISGSPYTLTIDTEGLKLVRKGKRIGLTLLWQDLVSGDAALTTALNASLRIQDAPPSASEKPGPAKSIRRPKATRKLRKK